MKLEKFQRSSALPNYRPQRSCGKVMFSQATGVCDSVHRGAMCGRGVCVVGGMHGRGHVWRGACVAVGSCMAGGGHAWQGGMHGRGHVWQGAVQGRVCGGNAWWERWPLQRTVRIILECILVLNISVQYYFESIIFVIYLCF